MDDKALIYARRLALRITKEGDLLEFAIAALVKDSLDAIVASDPTDTAGRERQYQRINALGDLKAEIEKLAHEDEPNE